MKYSLTISQLDEHTKALLNLIKTTENVSLDIIEDEFTLSDIQQSVLNKRYEKHLNKESDLTLWQDVKSRF